MRYNLPEDLKPFEPKRSIKILRIIAHILISILMVHLGKWLGQAVFKTNPTLKIIVYVVIGVIIAAFIVSLFFERAPDVTCAGVVEDVKVRTKTSSSTPERPTRETLSTKLTVELFVRQPDGAAIWVTAMRGEAESADYAERFKNGVEVFHLVGRSGTVILPTDKDTNVDCAVCGRSNPKGNDVCDKCGHTLIKSLTQIT